MPGAILNRATTGSKIGIVNGPVETGAGVYPAWQAMIRFCRERGCGEIACTKTHDGLPISAEVITRRFAGIDLN